MSTKKFLVGAFFAVAYLAIPHVAGATSFPASGSGNAVAAELETKIAGSTAAGLGPLAPVFVCPTGSESSTNSVASISSAPYVASGSAVDRVISSRTSTSATVQSTSTIQNVNILNGAIQAAALSAVANSSGTSAGAASNPSGTTFTKLVINGTAYSASPPANTKITLPGLGYVVLNQQIPSKSGTTFTSLIVNMIRVYVTSSNSAGIPVGVNFVVGHADSDLTLTIAPFDVEAGSFGLFARAGSGSTTATSGPWAPAGICKPTTTQIELTGVSSPFGSVGAMVDTASGGITPSSINGAATSKVASAQLLGGLISGGALQSTAAVTFNGTASASGNATFTNLSIAGLSINVSPPANTQVDIPGVGYVVLNEQLSVVTKKTIEEHVTAMDVFITTPNTLGLAVGAEVKIGSAKAEIESY
jgi:hypothetical protein